MVGLEAHSCGLPIVAFNVGGIPEIITHKKTGYLAKAFFEKDFINGIDYVYKYKNTLGVNALNKSKKWSPKITEQQYSKLFNSL